ncbi:hypothetical protein SHKM778_77110 [Streptomyces sp. KM77-8]|uniref:Uncharacterized protein n=1 Tax=Streptomyces haneummycinicus TaxID=3074435 RepID=A0AAT9HUN1_9ACTN
MSRGGDQAEADVDQGPAEAGAQAAGAHGRGGEAVGVGFRAEVGGAGVVQGETGFRMHRAASHSVRVGKAWVWTRTCSLSGVPGAGALPR